MAYIYIFTFIQLTNAFIQGDEQSNQKTDFFFVFLRTVQKSSIVWFGVILQALIHKYFNIKSNVKSKVK